MPTMTIGAEEFDLEDVGHIVRMIKGSPAGEVLLRVIDGLTHESRDALVGDLEPIPTAKLRGAIQTLEGLKNLLAVGLSQWRDSVNGGTPKANTEEQTQ